MKRLLILFAALAVFSCTSALQDKDEMPQTRAAVNTIWEHQTEEDLNQYILVSDEGYSIFKGVVEDGELQRWSEFYPIEEVEYFNAALWYHARKFSYYGDKVSEIEVEWMSITVTIKPFEFD